MQLTLMINEEEHIMEAEADETLLDVLRRKGITSVKDGCRCGSCGCCTVLADGSPIPSCLIPAAAMRDSNLITIEHFKKSDMYNDILQGFEKAGVQLCGYCNAGKIFAAYDLITNYQTLDRDIIRNEVLPLSCRCTELTSLINGILFAASFHLQRKRKASS